MRVFHRSRVFPLVPLVPLVPRFRDADNMLPKYFSQLNSFAIHPTLEILSVLHQTILLVKWRVLPLNGLTYHLKRFHFGQFLYTRGGGGTPLKHL
jgi:hypothetical protein